MKEPETADFGVYVHWPFCAAKCPYCDFNSHVRHGGVDQARYVEAYRRAIAHQAALAPGQIVRSIFFGGGTPSLMEPKSVADILDAIALHWSIAADAEITLEANPTSVEAERFRGYRSAGVNRVSLGVQALHDADLKALGRLHSVAEALAAVRLAASIFPRLSFDLIYARPGQSPQAWADELRRAIGETADHLSLYQLTIEPDTAFAGLQAAGKLVIPDDEAARALWDVTQETCEAAGLPAYEVSNHARPGAESRHNLIYWRYGDYAGIGPGAHGRLGQGADREAFVNAKRPEEWLNRVESEGHGLSERSFVSTSEQGEEFLLMGLRLSEGIDPGRYEALTGQPLSQNAIAFLRAEGLIEQRPNGRLAASRTGLPVLNAVIAALVT
jgi:putative oxygen-independent coproporphyrinogen III oxidase